MAVGSFEAIVHNLRMMLRLAKYYQRLATTLARLRFVAFVTLRGSSPGRPPPPRCSGR
ncbi:MAG: hypothetical protein M1582_03960 [Actinobacteria bacterium]|nr:hypothetical protein [Actinomycetota bacterium]